MSDKIHKKIMLNSLVIPTVFVVIIWLVKFVEILFDLPLYRFGIFPLSYKGLPGLLFAPLIHGDFAHLYANTIPVFVLTASLFYFYREIALKVFLLIYFFSNVWLWFGAREVYHIGASGLIYGLAAFLFISGLIRKNPRLMAISLFVAFLYGSLIWGIFPEFFPDQNISFEGHFWGIMAGVIIAVYFRKSGPQRKLYSWDLEDEDEDDGDDEGAYWNVPHKGKP
jgi:membrane associated rhomboid family serine protease